MQRLMFRDHQPDGWQFLHLASLPQHHRRFLGQRHLAARADYWPMFDHRAGGCHQPQRLAAMANLPARLLPAPPAQALGLARQSVT